MRSEERHALRPHPDQVQKAGGGDGEKKEKRKLKEKSPHHSTFISLQTYLYRVLFLKTNKVTREENQWGWGWGGHRLYKCPEVEEPQDGVNSVRDRIFHSPSQLCPGLVPRTGSGPGFPIPVVGGYGETEAYLGGSSGEGDLCNWIVPGQRDRE